MISPPSNISAWVVAMAGSFFCRKCLRSRTVKFFFTGFSRMAASSTPPSSFDPPIGEEHLKGNNDYINNAVALVVIAIAVTALVCLCLFLWLFRCNRPSDHHRAGAAATAGTSSSAVVVPLTATVGQQQEESSQNELGGEGCSSTGGGKYWSAKWVELVVMAGEDRPTFVAHPVGACSSS